MVNIYWILIRSLHKIHFLKLILLHNKFSEFLIIDLLEIVLIALIGIFNFLIVNAFNIHRCIKDTVKQTINFFKTFCDFVNLNIYSILKFLTVLYIFNFILRIKDDILYTMCKLLIYCLSALKQLLHSVLWCQLLPPLKSCLSIRVC